MPQLNLTAATGQELRQLLDTSRRQGDAALSYRILQEMAARREASRVHNPFKSRRAGEPRHILVEADEPLETADDIPPMPAIRFPAQPGDRGSAAPDTVQPESRSRRKPPTARTAPPAASSDGTRPLTLRAVEPPPPDEPADADDLRMHPPEQPRRRARGGLPFPVAAAFVFGIAGGTVVGWSVALLPRDAPPAVAQVQTAALAPAPAPAPVLPVVAEPEPQPQLQPAPEATAEPAAEAPETAAPSAASAESAAADVQGEALELPPPPPLPSPRKAETVPEKVAPRPERPATAVSEACTAEPTAADRAICGDPKLKLLQRELRRAYNEALAAHEDRTLLREHQLAWRDARNTVSDPNRLAAIYEARIRKLNAATAEARRLR